MGHPSSGLGLFDKKKEQSLQEQIEIALVQPNLFEPRVNNDANRPDENELLRLAADALPAALQPR